MFCCGFYGHSYNTCLDRAKATLTDDNSYPVGACRNTSTGSPWFDDNYVFRLPANASAQLEQIANATNATKRR